MDACFLDQVFLNSIYCLALSLCQHYVIFLLRKACVTLLNMGADVDSTDNNSRTPLMWAAKRKNLQCAQVLLEFKAFVGLQDTDGDSALHVACGQGHAAMVTLLLDSGASLMLRNERQNACLEVAAKAGASDVAMAIVKHKRLVQC